MPEPIEAHIVIEGVTYRGVLIPDVPDPPAPLQRTFSVWTGANIPVQYQSEPQIAEAIGGLCPWPIEQTVLEWWIKAGEGGSWEAEWDTHTLAIDSAQGLRDRVQVMAHLGIRVVPWVVVRGKPEWEAGEREMIRQCADIAGACVMNLEPGRQYWVGSKEPELIGEWIDRIGVPTDKLWLTAIPRHSAAAELGGTAAMQAWLGKVAGASWEVYDATSADLNPDVALPRVDAWDTTDNPWKRIPLIQRSRIAAWADSHWAAMALQVWTLGSD